MTFDEFLSKWTNQPVDFDQIYPNQCMDLMHQYVYDVLGFTDKNVLAAPAAYQVYTNFSNETGAQYFEKIDNTPDGIPRKGDIVFFGTAIGAYGHVCIFVDGDQNNFNSFDANWPTGSLPHIQQHNYTGVLGWLRAKPQVSMATITQAELDQIRADRDKNWTLYQQTLGDVAAKQNEIGELNATIANLQQELAQNAPQSPVPSEPVQPTTPTYPDLSGALATCQTDNQTLTRQIIPLQQRIQQIKTITYGKGWAWTKLYQIKAVLSQLAA